MNYLSIDLEATGLNKNDQIIEFACIAFSAQKQSLYEDTKFHCHIYCPSFEELKPKLNPWVAENNKTLIEISHKEGISIQEFQIQFETYLKSDKIRKTFSEEKIVLFGKSINAIDLPFLNRDLGWEFMKKYFHHQVLDLSCIVRSLVDAKNFLKNALVAQNL